MDDSWLLCALGFTAFPDGDGPMVACRPMQPHVRFGLPDGSTAEVRPGGILGRLETAQLRFADPRLSEAHALLSLRGQELHLLALRGRLAVDGQDEDDVPLVVGQRIELASGVTLEVLALHLPPTVLAIRLPGQPERELCAPVYSLLPGDPPQLVPRLDAAGCLRIWSTGGGWWARGDGAAFALTPGQRFTAGGVPLETCVLPIDRLSRTVTAGPGRVELLDIALREETVHLFRHRREPVALGGLPARVLQELAAFNTLISWRMAASEIWPAERDLDRLRRNWDRAVRRLRIKLREAGVRDDLVRSDGRGGVELLLYPGDRVRDED